MTPARPPLAAVSITVAARVLGLNWRTVRGWADAGGVEFVQLYPRGMRLIPSSEVERLAALYGTEPRWEEAL